MKHALLLLNLAFLLLFPSVALARQDIIQQLQVHVSHNGEFNECLLHIHLSLDSTLIAKGDSPYTVRYSLWMHSPHSNTTKEIEIDGATTISLTNTFSCQHSFHVSNVKFWNDEEPVRYTFRTDVISADGHTFLQKEIPVALSDCRVIPVPAYSDEFNIGGNCLCCNGEIIRMKGIYFDRSQWKRLTDTYASMSQLVCQMKRIHVNTVAFPLTDYDVCRQWLALCDSAGLYAIPCISSLRDTAFLHSLTSCCAMGMWMTDKERPSRHTDRLVTRIKEACPRQQFIYSPSSPHTSMALWCDPIASDVDTILQDDTPTVTPGCFLFKGADTSSIALLYKKVLSNNRVNCLLLNSTYLKEHADWVADLYQPCTINIIDMDKGYVSVKNLNTFTSLQQGILQAAIFQRNQKIWEKSIDLPVIAPRDIVTVQVPYKLSLDKNAEYILKISVINDYEKSQNAIMAHGTWHISASQDHP